MDLNEQFNLLNIVKSMIAKYQEELTTYARLNSDPTFEKLGRKEEDKFTKMNQFVELKMKIEKQIEDLVYEEYIKKN